MQYPIPSHAVSAWIGTSPSGDLMLFISLPPQAGNTSGSTITIPPNERGMDILTAILRERALAPPKGQTIGTRSVPLQSMLEALARTEVKPRRVEASVEDVESWEIPDNLTK